MVGGSVAPVVISTGGFTVTERGCEVLTAPALSVTVTAKLKMVDDATTGAVPESTPAPESESHAGRPDPCQENGEVPPVSANCWL